jgi:hypothetical protein
VPRHVARLVTRLVTRLVVDNSASRRLIVDNFASAARPGASARRAARRLSSTTSPPPRIRVPRHVERFITRLVAPLVADYSASRRLVIDYFTYAACLVASARCAACCMTHRRPLRLAQARR